MQRLFLLLLTMCCFLVSGVVSAAETQITDVKWGVSKDNILRIVTDLTDNAAYNVELQGNSLVLRVDAPAAGNIPKRRAVKSTVANELLVEPGNGHTIIKLPLTKQLVQGDYKAFVLKKDPATNRPFRIVLDVTVDKGKAVLFPPKTTSNPSAAAKPSASKGSVAKQNAAQVSNSGPIVGNKPVVSNKPVTGGAEAVKPAPQPEQKPVVSTTSKDEEKIAAWRERHNKEKKEKEDKKKEDKKEDKDQSKGSGFRTGGGLEGKVITIDAGHGGSDPGAIGQGGLKEKQVTLPIAELLKERLEKMGAKVYMTRTTDKDVYGPHASDKDELQARVNVAEKHDSDLFISLHINSSVNRNVGGISTYYFPKTANDGRLARVVQNELSSNFGVDNLGIREANFYVVKRCTMPAILVELCFISNPKEEKLLAGKWFRKKAARLMAEGIEKYFK